MNTHLVTPGRNRATPERVDPRLLRRIVIVDESTLQRRGIAHALNRPPYRRVTHTSASIAELLARLRPDHPWPHLLVVAFPARPPQADIAAAVAPALRSRLRVIAVTAGRTGSDIRGLLDAAFDGIATTRDDEQELLQVVDTVLDGLSASSPSIRDIAAAPVERPRLSMQEERVLTHYAVGMTISQVAAAIGVRQDTARKYLSRVKAKYVAAGQVARTRLDLSRIAHRDGYTLHGHSL